MKLNNNKKSVKISRSLFIQDHGSNWYASIAALHNKNWVRCSDTERAARTALHNMKWGIAAQRQTV